MQAAMGPLLKVSKCLFGPVSRRIGYMNNLNKNYEDLNRKIHMLHARMEDVNRKISRKRATSECAYWRNEVDKIQNKRKEIEEEYQQNKTCPGGWCHNPSRHSNLGKWIVALIQETDDRIEKSGFKEDVVVNEPQQIMEVPTIRKLEGNSTVDQTLQELLSMIKDANINRIGLWGMGGIGKTTIMKVLQNCSEIVQMFQIIIWVTVSKEGTNRNVQEELALRLNLQRQDGEYNDSLKSKVFMGLKTKKFLLLLDDVWDEINLEEVGVLVLDEGNPGCKVALSTRHLPVCRKARSYKEIKVKALLGEETWSLFRWEVGEVVDDSRIEALSRKVAAECCGLPLAIVVLDGALRNEEDIHLWRYTLKELSSAGEIEDMEEKIYRHLKYSYDWLKDERLKESFLYCALFPEDFEIQKAELIKYWINEDLIDGWSNLEEAEDKGFSKLKELMDASLLEKGRSKNFVKMHGVMRDLALRISSLEGGPMSLVKAGVKLSEVPKVENWEKTKRISLMKNDLKALPQIPLNCPFLTTLLLQQNFELPKIPSNFFLLTCP